MKRMKPTVLSARIVNCLQTILELEPLLRSLDTGQLLLSEFKTLKAFLKEMDAIALDEDDVERIETATERFLQELKLPVTRSRDNTAKNMTLQ